MLQKLELKSPVRYLKGVGPKRAEVFKKAGISTIEDLLYYFPRRYEDRSKLSTVSELKEGQMQAVKVKILKKNKRQSWKRRSF